MFNYEDTHFVYNDFAVHDYKCYSMKMYTLMGFFISTILKFIKKMLNVENVEHFFARKKYFL